MRSHNSQVHVLDSNNFKTFVNSRKVVLVAFLVLPHSERSQRFAARFEEIAYILQDTEIVFAQVNALSEPDVWVPFDTPLYCLPRLGLFRRCENVTWYRDTLGTAEVISFLNHFLAFPTLTSVSRGSIHEFKESNNTVVVAFVDDKDIDQQQRFHRLAEKLFPKLVFGMTTDRVLIEDERILTPGIKVYRQDEMTTLLPFVDDDDELTRSLQVAARPNIIVLAEEFLEDLYDLELPIGCVFTSDSEQRGRLQPSLISMARDCRQHLLIAVGDMSEHDYLVDDLRLETNLGSLRFAIRNTKTFLRYPMLTNATEGDFVRTIRKFTQAVLQGTSDPAIKSEPLPPASDEALQKVVAYTYRDIVIDNDKDVLLAYCTSWCGPCEHLKPTLHALARAYQSHPLLSKLVSVAIIDPELNDVPERAIRVFPTLKMFAARKKNSPVRLMNGDDTMEGLADFMKREGSHGADLGLEGHG